MTAPLRFAVASEPGEFEQIFRLNYDTFVDEIPQHPPNAERRLVDRFHDENTYLVAAADDEVVGMVAMRGTRPFSLDEKLGDISAFLPPGRRICELRLLAVRPEHRKSAVFRGLVDLILRHGVAAGYDLAVISGTLRQQKLYRHLGFVPFGPVVGTGDALFQPMYLTLEQFEESVPALSQPREPVSFLPGPVPLSPEVMAALNRPPAYHRDERFAGDLQRAKARLCALTHAERVEVLLGSGTLANDLVAAQLSLLDAPGLVLSNGEFGDRLIDHATRMRLDASPIRFPWGVPFDLSRVRRLIRGTNARWLWMVASETSTGMLNDLPGFLALAREHDVKLCLDCVSTVGAVPVDLRRVFLASGASGKALAGLPGLSFVFYSHDVAPQPTRLPRYLDLGYYASKAGVPFTHSSNLVASLGVALERFDDSRPFEEIRQRASWLRGRLDAIGLHVLVPESLATPAVVTLDLPETEDASALGGWLAKQGLLVAYQSEYLARRNWLQIAVMGHCTIDHLSRLVDALARRPGAPREAIHESSRARPDPRRRWQHPDAAGAARRRQAPLH